MPLHEPVAVYNAATNLEAHQLCNLLSDAGIEAFSTEDLSVVGGWYGGLVPEIHKPQVWVDRADVDRTVAILDHYESRLRELRPASTPEGAVEESPVDAVCEECGQQTSFPAGQLGSVQNCPNCGAFMDVGEPEPFDETAEGEAEESEAEPPEDL